MKTVFTKKGQPIYVDDADYDWAMQWRWYINSSGYAARSSKSICGQKRSMALMHRLILDVTDSSINVDHRNGIRHDNQRHNLRTCTKAQNSWNRPAQQNNTSGYKGVSRHTNTGKWQAIIGHNGARLNLGLFESAEAAHAAYCAKARELHGEYANTGEQNDRAQTV